MNMLTFKAPIEFVADDILHEPALDKTYNKTCDQPRVGLACTSTKYDKGSRLSLSG